MSMLALSDTLAAAEAPSSRTTGKDHMIGLGQKQNFHYSYREYQINKILLCIYRSVDRLLAAREIQSYIYSDTYAFWQPFKF